MPIYEFVCEHCGAKQELILPSFDTVFPPCKQCGYFALHRVKFSRPADPAFKGSGFYATDYKGKP